MGSLPWQDDRPATERAWEYLARSVQLLIPDEERTIPVRQERMSEWWDRVVGAPLWSAQREIMDLVEDNRYTSIASAVGIGKSETAAAIVLSFLHTREDSIAITTAPTNNLVKTVLWRYIRRIYGEHKHKLLGKALTQEYQIGPAHYGLGFKASDTDADRFRGLHSASGNILVVVDEAQGVHDNVIKVLHNVMSQANARFMMIGNPASLDGEFRASHHEKADVYVTRSISVYDSPNFTGEVDWDPSIAFLRDRLPDKQFVEDEIRLNGGWDSDYVRVNIRALWPLGTTNTLIALNDIDFCAKQAGELHTGTGRYYAGVDVARFGDDESSCSIRFGQEEIAFAAWKGNDTVESANYVERMLRDLELNRDWDQATTAEIRVDAIGVGAGVADTLRHRGFKVRDVNVGWESSDKTQWKNLRHELWWQLKTIFEEHRIAPAHNRWDYTDLANPVNVAEFDRTMRAQLSNIMYSYTKDVSYEKPLIEDKESMKKRLGYSPDRAEALLLSYGRIPKRGVVGAFAMGKTKSKR